MFSLDADVVVWKIIALQGSSIKNMPIEDLLTEIICIQRTLIERRPNPKYTCLKALITGMQKYLFFLAV